MSVVEMTKYIGRTGMVHLRDECTVQMRIVDVKLSYGNVRFKVEPLAGTGFCWIGESTIALEPAADLHELRTRLAK